MIRVMRKHRAAADEIDPEFVPEAMLSAAKQSWDEAIGLGEIHGYPQRAGLACSRPPARSV